MTGMPDEDTITLVQGFVEEVMRRRTHLEEGQAGIIAVALIPPIEIETMNEKGETKIVRSIRFPRWTYSCVVNAPPGSHPLPAASQELDRVRFYLSLAAGRNIPVGAYVYAKTSHAPVYRGYEDLALGVLDPFECEQLSDQEIEKKITGWYRKAEEWLKQVPRSSILDAAIMTRMRGFFASNRRDAILGAWSALEALAEAAAEKSGWLDSAPSRLPHRPAGEVSKALRLLLHRWSPESESRIDIWRRTRNRLVHPYGQEIGEQIVWDLSRELVTASGLVLLGVLADMEVKHPES